MFNILQGIQKVASAPQSAIEKKGGIFLGGLRFQGNPGFGPIKKIRDLKGLEDKPDQNDINACCTYIKNIVDLNP